MCNFFFSHKCSSTAEAPEDRLYVRKGFNTINIYTHLFILLCIYDDFIINSFANNGIIHDFCIFFCVLQAHRAGCSLQLKMFLYINL